MIRNMKKAILFCVMMMTMVMMSAQDEYYIKNYGKTDELKVRGATCIAQINGFLWIGTSTGFTAFDGNHMHTYTIPDKDGKGGFYSRVVALESSSDHNLWIGTRKGIYEFEMITENMHLFEASGLPKHPDVRAIKFDKDENLWGILNGKAYKMDVKKKTAECIGEGVMYPSCMTIAKDGTVWFGDSNGMLYRYDVANRRLRSYNAKPEGVEKLTNLSSITEMRNGKLALVTYKNGVFLFSPKDLTSKVLMTHDEEGEPIIAHTSITPDGDELWVGSERGIIIYRMRDGHIRAIRQSRTAVNALSDNAVHSLFVDSENGVWAGTFFGGMNRISLSPQNFSVLMPEDDKDNTDVFRELCEDHDGHLWAGSEDGGLYLVDRENGVLHKSGVNWAGEEPPFNIQSLMMVDDDLWLSSITNGIYVVDTKAMKLLRRYRRTNNTAEGSLIGGISMCQQQGTIFVSSSTGVYIFDKKEESFIKMPELINTYTHHLYADRKGNVWVATFDKGLWKIQKKNGRWKAERTKFAYPCTTVIMEDSRGTYWVGTDLHGLVSYNDKTGETKQQEESEGLQHETVTNILEDTHHRLWISTFNGLYSYNLDKKIINHMTLVNGLPSTYLNYASGYSDKDGFIYIGTYKGLVCFTPNSFVLSKDRLKPYFLNLYVNGKHITPNDETGILKQTLFETKELTLTRDQNTFTIMYAVASYRSGENVWYRYRMNPDEPWTVTDNAQPIQLTNLSTGTYRITLQASYNPERWEGEAAVLILKVDTPIWLSPFAFICYAAVIIGLVVLVMSLIKKWEIKQLKKKHKQKETEN